MKLLRCALLCGALLAGAVATTTGANASPLAGPTRCFTGVGVMVAMRGLTADELRNPDTVHIQLMKPLMVMRVIPDSPAAQGHIYGGDTIVKVNGVNVRGKTLPEVVAMIDGGAAGTQVTITVKRDGGRIQRDIVLTRDTLCINTP